MRTLFGLPDILRCLPKQPHTCSACGCEDYWGPALVHDMRSGELVERAYAQCQRCGHLEWIEEGEE